MENRTRRILTGCGIGCAAALLLMVGSCISFVVWLNRPGQVLEPAPLLGADTTGYVEWTMRLADPGTALFLENLLEKLGELQEAEGSPFPPALNRWLADRRRRAARRDIEKLLPLLVVWTVRPAAGAEEDSHLVTISARGLGRRMVLADWLLGFIFGRIDEIDTVEHHGEEIHRISDEREEHDFALFIHRGTLFFTTDVPTAQQAIDRLMFPDSTRRDPTELERLFARVPRDRSLRGAISNTGGQARRLARLLGLDREEQAAADDLWTTMTGVTLHGGFGEGTRFEGLIEFHGPDARWAEAHAERVAGMFGSLFDAERIDIEIESRADENRIRTDIRVQNLDRLIPQESIPDDD